MSGTMADMKRDALRETVYAFNNTDIVATYDIGMDVWHPNRVKMASTVCELLPFDRVEKLSILEEYREAVYGG